MGRRRKTLVELCRDGTFLARRHEHLLDGSELPDAFPAPLREVHAEFRATKHPMLRRAVALIFQKLVQQYHAESPEERRDRVLTLLEAPIDRAARRELARRRRRKPAS